MSSLLRKRFDSSKCKTLLQLTSQRLKVLKNKQALAVKKARGDVAKLLEKGQDSNANMQVETIFRQEKIVALYELLDQFCHLVINRLESIKSQKECPSDLKEAVASLIFAAPKCAELEELKRVAKQLMSKYGTDFSVAVKELRPDCGVNKQIIQSLSSRSPDSDARLKMLKEIAVENNIHWEYEMAAADASNGDTDLIDGPKHFASATELSEVDTYAIADKQKSRSMHLNEVKVEASAVLKNPISLHTMSAAASLGSPHHNMHQFVNINTNTGASRAQKVPDGVIHSPVLDPYALARAEGKMDYKLVYDYIGRTQVSEGHLNKGMELKQENRGGVAYGEPAMQAERDNALLDASNREDGLQRSKGKKAKKRSDVMDVHRRNEEGELIELKIAAETAFASATQAAKAARAAVDLVRMESLERSRGSKAMNNNEPREMHSESSSGSVRDDNHKLAGMDFKSSAYRDQFFCEDKVEIEPNQNNMMVGDQVSENIHSNLDASDDSFKYVVFEQTSGSQKYTQSSTQTDGHNTNAESYAFPTSYSRKHSGRIIFDAEPEESGFKGVPTNALLDRIYSHNIKEQELDKKSSFRNNQEMNFHHTDTQQDKYVQNDLSVPQFDDYSSEEDNYVQKDSLVPQSDDHNNEEASEEEEPFYLRGRAAMSTEDYANRTARAPYSRTNMLLSTVSSSTDDEAEEESSTNLRSSKQEANLHLDFNVEPLDVSNDKEENFISSGRYNVDKPSQELSFDDYAEPVTLPTQTSKPPFGRQISTDSISASSILSPVAYNDSSGKPATPRKLKWLSSASDEWDFDSSYDKAASPLGSVKLHSLNENGDFSSQVNRKLNWPSGASEDSEAMSERSLESHKLRWNPSSLEDLNLESPKPSFNTEDLTRASTMDPTQVTQASPRKSFYGVSKRSYRSTRSPPSSGNKDIRT